MGQRPPRLAFVFLLLIAPLIALAGCERRADSTASLTPSTTPASPATQPAVTVASLSPAATEILIGLGLGDRLVAVSNFDRPRPAIARLPRVGDYQTTDWERLATLRPAVMITQFGPNRLPAGMVQRADELHIRLVNVSITRLHDIFQAMTTLAAAVEAPERGAAAAEQLRQRLDAVAARSTGRRVRALIVVDDAARAVAGRGNYLDDILQIAGGENVLRGSAPYPSIDREMLLALDPEVILQLLPEPTAQIRAAAARVWESLPSLQAVQRGRVRVIDHAWSLTPTHHVAEIAETFAREIDAARGAAPATPATTAPAAASTKVPLSGDRS